MTVQIYMGDLGYQDADAYYTTRDHNSVVIVVMWRGIDIADAIDAERKSEIADDLLEAIEQKHADRQLEDERSA